MESPALFLHFCRSASGSGARGLTPCAGCLWGRPGGQAEPSLSFQNVWKTPVNAGQDARSAIFIGRTAVEAACHLQKPVDSASAPQAELKIEPSCTDKTFVSTDFMYGMIKPLEAGQISNVSRFLAQLQGRIYWLLNLNGALSYCR